MLRKKGWLEMTKNKNNKTKEYSFVIDKNGNKLAPCNINKAWILIRKKKEATLLYIEFLLKSILLLFPV